MRANPLTLGLAVLAAATVASVAVIFVRAGEHARPTLDRPDPIASVVAAPSVELDRVVIADVPESTRKAAPAVEPSAPSAVSARTYTFDVTFVTIDELGRSLPRVDVGLGLEGHRINEMGESGWNGDLHQVWTGTEPTLSAVVRTRRSGTQDSSSRVRLQAGRPLVLRLVADQPSPAAWSAFIQSASTVGLAQPPLHEFSNGSRWPQCERPNFNTEQDGRGTFTDPNLLSQVIVEGEPTSGGEFTSMRTGCSIGGTKLSSLPVLVHDESGAPLGGVSYLALTDGGPIEGVTDAEGRFVISVRRTYSLVVFVGGRDRALVRKSVDLTDLPSVIDVTLPRVAMALGRLVDSEGKPLADWLVRAHDTDAFGDFVGSTTTDAGGQFAMQLPNGGPVQLRVRPAANLSGLTCLVTRRFLGGNTKPVTVVVPASKTVGVICHVDLPADVEGNAPAIRLVRLDTGEVVELGPFEFGDVPGKIVRFGFRDDAMLPGDYALEILAPGCEQDGRASIHVDEGSNDLGVFAPKPRLRLRIDGADFGITDGGRAMVETKVQGVRFISATVLLPGLFAVPEGEFGLYVGRSAPRTGVAPTMYPFHTVKGHVVPVDDTQDPNKPR